MISMVLAVMLAGSGITVDLPPPGVKVNQTADAGSKPALEAVIAGRRQEFLGALTRAVETDAKERKVSVKVIVTSEGQDGVMFFYFTGGTWKVLPEEFR
jgi:hypothetical protein